MDIFGIMVLFVVIMITIVLLQFTGNPKKLKYVFISGSVGFILAAIHIYWINRTLEGMYGENPTIPMEKGMAEWSRFETAGKIGFCILALSLVVGLIQCWIHIFKNRRSIRLTKRTRQGQ